MPRAAMVLPPREGFAPGGTGAIGLLLARLARATPRWDNTILGMLPGGFSGLDYRQISLAFLPAQQWRRYAAGILRELKSLRPDIIEVHNRPDIARFLAKRLPNTPITLTLHNDPQGMRAAKTAAERAALLDTVTPIAVSAYLRARLLENLPNLPCHILPNCLDLNEIPPSPAERDKTILFAGRVVADKGADAFVAACAIALPLLPDWRAEIIGADRFGPNSPETDFLRKLRPQAAAANVTLRGYRPHTDVLAAMSRAAIVAVPSRWPEPFGLTALEALACGAALLCATTGGLPEVTGQAAMPISAADPAGIAAAIIALANNPAARETLAAAGRARAIQFSAETAGAALAALRSDILSAWQRRSPRPI